MELEEICARCGNRYGVHSPSKCCPSDVEKRKFYTWRTFAKMTEFESLQAELKKVKGENKKMRERLHISRQAMGNIKDESPDW